VGGARGGRGIYLKNARIYLQKFPKTKRSLNQDIWSSLSRIELPESRSELLALESTYLVEVHGEVLY
jgi:hypothetical protein